MKQGGGEQTLTVALRIRPMSEEEILCGATPIGHKVDGKVVVLMDPAEDPDDILRANRSRERNFVFDHAFDGLATQTDVYTATTKFLIPNITNGYNATVFAYGATGAGKTYTMLGTDSEPGIMACTLNDLFLEMEKTKTDMTYKVTMSYLEIYNEMIRDLLKPTSGILDLREDAKGGVQVAGLSEVTATSTSEVMKMLMMGNLERTQEPTAANLTSSRSHAVLQVTVKQRDRVRGVNQEVRSGRLFLIDLAGSERAANTLNRGKRMVEGAHINRSLLALGNCINALSENTFNGDKSGSKYVNYRDSKLTRLLKDALGGNCKTVMIAHISPASIHFEESRNTLVYADRAKHIKTKVHRNVTDVSYHIAQYTNIIAELRDEINRLRQKVQNQADQYSVVHIQDVHTEILSGSTRKEQLELAQLKEQLVLSFREQMECRRNLMALTNSSMEMSLETNRNQLIISEWEAEKSRKKRESTDDEKLSENGGSPEPDEVRIARDELKVLHQEKYRIEKIRGTVNKELTSAKAKVHGLQESLPEKVKERKHKEILLLLCRVHQLEIENVELQSECFVRDFQIRKTDMMIARYKVHKNICDEIIEQQRALINENKLAYPKELEDLLELYTVEKSDGMLSRADSHLSFPLQKGIGRLSSSHIPTEPDGRSSNDLLGSRMDNPSTKPLTTKDDALFRLSARAKQLKLQDSDAADRLTDIMSIKSPSPDVRLSLTPEDRQMIASRTRNIHVLAAKKRNKAQMTMLNFDRQLAIDRTLQRLSPLTDLVSDSEIYTSASRAGLSKQTGNISKATINRREYRAGVLKESNHRPHLQRLQTQKYNKNKGQYHSSDRLSNHKQHLPRPLRITRRNPPLTTYGSHLSSTASETSSLSTPKSRLKSKQHKPTIPSYRKGNISIMGYSLHR